MKRFLKRRLAVALALLLVLPALLAACNVVTGQMSNAPFPATGPASPTAPVNAVGPTTVTKNETDGLALTLSVNATTLRPGEGLAMTVVEENTLDKVNRVPAAQEWAVEGLTLGPCGTLNYPVGLALFKGYYTAATVGGSTPLKLYDPTVLYHCPMILAGITAYEFQPQSNVADVYGSCDPNPCIEGMTIDPYWTADGCWAGNPATFHEFEPGIYTVVGGNEWGALAFLYIEVKAPSGGG